MLGLPNKGMKEQTKPERNGASQLLSPVFGDLRRDRSARITAECMTTKRSKSVARAVWKAFDELSPEFAALITEFTNRPRVTYGGRGFGARGLRGRREDLRDARLEGPIRSQGSPPPRP